MLREVQVAFASHQQWPGVMGPRFRGDDSFVWSSQRVLVGLDCRYCTLSATKRSSPSALATRSSTDFLPSFFNWSTRFLMSAALATASCATSTMTSPAESRLSAASEPPSTLVTMTPLTLSLIL